MGALDRTGGRVRGLSYDRSLALVTALAAVVRLGLVARQPIGYDEDFSAILLHSDPGRMLDILARDSAPPLFYLVAWLPAQLGSSPAALRIVPALAGIALIPLLASLARRVGGDAAGLWTAAVVTFLPATIALSEFARPYSLAATLIAGATLAMWRAAESPTPLRWVAYAAVAAAAAWTDYFALVALLGIVAAGIWLRPRWRTVRPAVAATVAAGLTTVPWLAVAAPALLGHAGTGFWVPPLGPSMLGGTIGQLFGGPPVDSGLPYGPALFGLQVIADAIGFAALGVTLAAWRSIDPHARRAIVFCLLACLGVAGLALVSLWRPLLEARYAGLMWLPVFALAGVGLARLPRAASAVLVGALAVGGLAVGMAITHRQTSDLVPILDARVSPADLVAAAPDQYLTLLDGCAPGVRNQLRVLSADDPPWYMGTAAYPAGAVIHAVPEDVVTFGGSVFWVAAPGDPPPSLPDGYQQVESTCVIGACLTVYAPGE